ncbi:MAG TPA: hypothetical protein VHF25_00205 [Nitriliruptorales bacterium]|nr:hypothetical protein [Nitriliruptorales bacterium]
MAQERAAAETVGAEVEYRSRRSRAAAQALQQQGFQVLGVGATISVRAPAPLWTSVFGVHFEEVTATVAHGVTGSYLRPTTGGVTVPEDLSELIADVLFAEPPEFFAN